jgi:hypothetical protein
MATFFGTPGDDNRTGTAQGDNMVGLEAVRRLTAGGSATLDRKATEEVFGKC